MRLPAHRTRRPRTASASDTLQEAALSGSVSSSASAYLDMEKGTDSSPMVITLAPAENPPSRTLYHYIPPLVIFKASTLTISHCESCAHDFLQPIISFFTRDRKSVV